MFLICLTPSLLLTKILFIGISRIYVSVEFWMRACHDLEDTICRETFKIYYRHISSNEDISSDTVDLSEEFYFPVDTVAAEVSYL